MLSFLHGSDATVSISTAFVIQLDHRILYPLTQSLRSPRMILTKKDTFSTPSVKLPARDILLPAASFSSIL
jgi:hypothetical protein